MSSYSLSHLSDETLLRELAGLVSRERTATAVLLAHIAEVDARKLYLPAAHPSMFSYCVHELRLSEQAALKRICVARLARQLPAIFTAIADGRLNLSSVVMLATHLAEEGADELLAAAAHKTKSEIEQLIAVRFPRPDLPTRIHDVSPPPTFLTGQVCPVPVDELSPGRVEQRATEAVEGSAPHAKIAPLSPHRFALQLTIGQATYEKLKYAQSLLSHQLPSGDVAGLLDRALDALILKLEKRKFAATTEPRPCCQRSSANPRHIPAHVLRAVWERDQGQCTFVSDSGQRCPTRTRLEFDHVEEVARGGGATVSGIRLRCRSHNQYTAERTFGSEFMDHKREAARQAAKARREDAARDREAARNAESAITGANGDAAPLESAARAYGQDVIPWLRALGIRVEDARRAAAHCDAIPDASPEQRVRHALSCYGTRARSDGTAA